MNIPIRKKKSSCISFEARSISIVSDVIVISLENMDWMPIAQPCIHTIYPATKMYVQAASDQRSTSNPSTIQNNRTTGGLNTNTFQLEPYFCFDCQQPFTTAHNLHNHLKSSVHTPRDRACPMPGCTKTFLSDAHVLLHIDSGTCACGITRHQLDADAIMLDNTTDAVVVDTAMLCRGGNGKYQRRRPLAGPLDPSSSDNDDDNYIRRSKTRRGGWYVCPVCRAAFPRPQALQSHLNSPVHDERIYQCKAALDGCGAAFATLAGLLQHVEGGQCAVDRGRIESFVGRVLKW